MDTRLAMEQDLASGGTNEHSLATTSSPPRPHEGFPSQLNPGFVLTERNPEAPRMTGNSNGQAEKVILVAEATTCDLGGSKRKLTALGSDKESNLITLRNKPHVWNCSLCEVSPTCERHLIMHLQGKKHKAKAAPLRNCALCEVSCTCEENLNMHIQGKKHKAKAAKLNEETAKGIGHTSCENKSSNPTSKTNKMMLEVEVEENLITPQSKKRKFDFWCKSCHVTCQSENIMQSHCNGKRHKAQIKKLKLLGELKQGCGVTALCRTKQDESIPVERDASEEMNGGRKENTDEEVDAKADGRAEEVNEEVKAEENLTKQELEKKKFGFCCKICHMNCQTEVVLQRHCSGKRHKAQIENLKRLEVLKQVSGGTASCDMKPDCTIPEKKGASKETNGGRKKNTNEEMDANADERTEEAIHESNNAIENTDRGRKNNINEEVDSKEVETAGNREATVTMELLVNKRTEEASSSLKGECVESQLLSQAEVVTDISHLIQAEPSTSDLAGLRTKITATENDKESNLITSRKKPQVWSCALCEVSATCEKNLNMHFQGKKHIAKAAKLNKEIEIKETLITPEPKKRKFEFWCKDCNLNCQSQDVLRRHCKGKRHKAHMENLKRACGVTFSSNTKQGGIFPEENSASKETNEGRKENSSGEMDTKVDGKTEEAIQEGISASEEMSRKENINVEVEAEQKLIPPNSTKKFRFWCRDCSVMCKSEVTMHSHFNGKKHKKMEELKRLKVDAEADGMTEEAICESNDASEETKIGGRENTNEKVDAKEAVADTSPLIQAEPSTSDLAGLRTKITATENDKESNLITSRKKPQVWSCALCEVSATCEKNLNMHFQGKKHIAKAAKLNKEIEIKETLITPEPKKRKFEFWCKDCNLNCQSQDVLRRHCKGKRHKAHMENLKRACGVTFSSNTKQGGIFPEENSASKETNEGRKENSSGEMDTKVDGKTEEAIQEGISASEEMSRKENINVEVEAEQKLIPPNSTKKFRFWCRDCSVMCKSEVTMHSHFNGKKHKKMEELKRLKVDAETDGMTEEAICESNDASEETKIGGRENTNEKVDAKEAVADTSPLIQV